MVHVVFFCDELRDEESICRLGGQWTVERVGVLFRHGSVVMYSLYSRES